MSHDSTATYFVGSAYGPEDAEADRQVKEFLRTATPAQRRAIFVKAYFNVGPLPRAEVDELVRQIERRPRYEVVLTLASPTAGGVGSLVPPEARNTRRCFVSDDERLRVAVTHDGNPCGYIEVPSDGRSIRTAGALEVIEGQHHAPRFNHSQIDEELRRVMPKYIERLGTANVTLSLRGVQGYSGWMGSATRPIEHDDVGPVEATVTDAARDVPPLVDALWRSVNDAARR